MDNNDLFFIRKLNETDLLNLQKIGKQTFYETFALDEANSDMQQYLAEKFHINQLRKEITNPDSRFFFAEINNTIVGYLKINTGKAQTESKFKDTLEIERIYIIATYQRKNIGKALLNKSIEIAKKEKIKNIWLGVWEHNHQAIKFYHKNGFTKFGEHKFKFGQTDTINILMKLQVK